MVCFFLEESVCLSEKWKLIKKKLEEFFCFCSFYSWFFFLCFFFFIPNSLKTKLHLDSSTTPRRRKHNVFGKKTTTKKKRGNFPIFLSSSKNLVDIH